MCWMTCGGCGHKGDFNAFCNTLIFGALPVDTYQCPACGLAIERRHGAPKVTASGYVVPGKIELTTVESRM